MKNKNDKSCNNCAGCPFAVSSSVCTYFFDGIPYKLKFMADSSDHPAELSAEVTHGTEKTVSELLEEG